MRRAHDPSRLRRRSCGLRRHPQQQTGDAGGLCCQRQLAAGDEIELPSFAPDFQHHRANRVAGQRVGGGAQCDVDVGGAHGHHAARIEAEFGEASHRQRSGFNFGKILPNPHQWPPYRYPPRKPRDEAGRRRALTSLGKHLVHGGQREAALQRRVGIGMSQRHAQWRRVGMRLDPLDAAAQTRKHGHARARHAPLSRRLGRHRSLQ
jgi:hypothetical protein